MTFLDKLLQGLPEDVKNNVQRVIINYKLDPNNPEILLAILCGHIESLTTNLPIKIASQIDDSVKSACEIAKNNIKMLEKEIQCELSRLVEDNSEKVLRARIQSSRFKWFCAACCLSFLMAGSCLSAGYKLGFGERDAQCHADSTRLTKIASWISGNACTEEDFALIKWSLSKDGRTAKKLSLLNGGLTNFIDCYSTGNFEWRGNVKYCFPVSDGGTYGWAIDIK